MTRLLKGRLKIWRLPVLVQFTAIFPFSLLSLPCVVPNVVFLLYTGYNVHIQDTYLYDIACITPCTSILRFNRNVIIYFSYNLPCCPVQCASCTDSHAEIIHFICNYTIAHYDHCCMIDFRPIALCMPATSKI